MNSTHRCWYVIELATGEWMPIRSCCFHRGSRTSASSGDQNGSKRTNQVRLWTRPLLKILSSSSCRCVFRSGGWALDVVQGEESKLGERQASLLQQNPPIQYIYIVPIQMNGPLDTDSRTKRHRQKNPVKEALVKLT